MAMSNVLSASGNIIKKEYVCNTRIKSLKNYLILESTDPFPEAHFRHKSEFVKFYYVAIKADKLDQDIKIAAQSAEGQMEVEVASALGEIQVENKTYYAVRLRNITSQMLPRLVRAYEYEGIHMHPFEGNVSDYAWIQVRKFFHLEEIEEGIFTDLDDPLIGYLEAPRKLEWEELEDLTKKVKEETLYPNFDKAMGTISKHGEPKDIIRIYEPHMSEDILKDISKTFRAHFSEL